MTGRETVALITLGSNQPSEQGGPKDAVEAALTLLDVRGITIGKTSRWFHAPAWPAGSGPDYVNGAALISAPFPERRILDILHKVETILGRTRNGDRWAPRTCDLDMIASGAAVWPGAEVWRHYEAAPPETPRDCLLLPHPQMHRRAFVLKPLAEVAPDWRHPMLGLTVTEMLDQLPHEDCAAITPLP